MASAIVNKCLVYLNPIEAPIAEIPRQMPAPQRIGAIWARAAAIFNGISRESPIPLLARLGVSIDDQRAHEVLVPMMEMACGADIKITPSKEDSGVYYLSKEGEKFAVFKVGTRRMTTECLARKIALKMGLERHVIPGVYCTIANPSLPKEDEMCEELWNGNVKIYKETKGDEKPLTLTGILEPFIQSKNPVTPDDIGDLTSLAFLLGLRDGKLDGKFGSQFVDVEDIMPLRLLPGPGKSPNKSVAATHLPFLSDPLAKKPLSPAKVQDLARRLVQIEASTFQMLADLEREKVEYEDLPSERLMAFKEGFRPSKELKGKDSGLDHGGFQVQAVQQQQIMENHPKVNVQATDRLMLKEQLLAFDDRVTSLKKFVDLCAESGYYPTSIELITNADQMYGAHLSALVQQQPRMAQTAFDLVGVLTPDATRSPLALPDRERIRSAPHSSMVRSISGSSEPQQLAVGSATEAPLGLAEAVAVIPSLLQRASNASPVNE